MKNRSPDDSGFLRGLPDDGLYLPSIKEHSFEKIRRHNCYAQMFATSMKNVWPQRAYVGLCSGAGRARVDGSNEIIETTAMSVFRLPDLFTTCIFVDWDERCTNALEKRIAALHPTGVSRVIRGDANDPMVVESIRAALPAFSRAKGLLSFCFVDPFAASLRFGTIRALGRYRMDFLILLPLGVDVRRNFKRYYEDRSDTHIENLIDCPGWREEYVSAKDTSVVRFVLRKFDEAMIGLGYRPAEPHHHHPVKVRGKGVMQYILVFYSKHPLAQNFWESTLAGSDRQLDLEFPE